MRLSRAATTIDYKGIFMEIALIIIGIIIIILTALYLFLIAPGAPRDIDKFKTLRYAHRGLHGDGIAENSMSAFRAAVEGGFGIELDVRLSSDNVLVVFHDDTLDRVVGREGRVDAFTAAELSEMSLSGTEDGIPTFEEVLRLVDGRVPMLIELKGATLDTTLCGKAYELLKDYGGSFCLESFNPWLVKGIKDLMPERFCGLLYSNIVRDKKREGNKANLIDVLASVMAFTFVCRPHFMAYNEEDRDSIPVALSTRFYKTPKFVWTVTSKDAVERAHALGEYPIFEKIDRK